MRKFLLLLIVLCVNHLQAQSGLLDLKPTGGERDLNGLKLDPKWRCQDDQKCNQAPNVPDATICDHLTGQPVSATCRMQPTSDDVPTAIFKRMVCSLAPSLLHGHVNFEEPIALTGNLEWDGHSDDFDYDFLLTTRDGRLVTSHNSQVGTIALELDSRETVDRFASVTGWWSDFKSRVANPAQLHTVPDLFDNHSNNAVAVGLLGVDCEHQCHSELHPIFALAFRASDSTAAREHWIVLARNFGDEGFCSHLKHALGSTSSFPQLHILIPKAAIDVAATGTFSRTAGASGRVTLTPVQGVGIDVSLPLAAPTARQVYLGEVWVTGSSPLTTMSRAARPTAVERREEEGSESVLRGLVANMPSQKRQALHAASRELASQPIVARAAPQPPISIDDFAWRKEHRSSELRVVPSDVDVLHEQSDLLLWKRICESYGNQLPNDSLRDACSPAALTPSTDR